MAACDESAPMPELPVDPTSHAALLEPSPLRAARERGLGEGALWHSPNSRAPLTLPQGFSSVITLFPDGKAVREEGAKAA